MRETPPLGVTWSQPTAIPYGILIIITVAAIILVLFIIVTYLFIFTKSISLFCYLLISSGVNIVKRETLNFRNVLVAPKTTFNSWFYTHARLKY